MLINNAGLAKGRDTLATIRDEDLTEMIDVNVTGFLRVARAFLPGMIARKSGHVINLGSLAGRQVYEGGAVYCATKYAVKAITQTLRLELSGTNIRVTEIAPGLVETEFSVVRMGDVAKAKAAYQGFVPLTAIDIADCVTWAVNRPAHVNIGEIVLTPVAQASVSKVHRTERQGIVATAQPHLQRVPHASPSPSRSTMPAIGLRLAGHVEPGAAARRSSLNGGAVVAAAFLLAWGARPRRKTSREISRWPCSR